jgi:putative redox protein
MTEPAGIVVVAGSGDGFTQEITAGRHHLRADEPIDAGGADLGPGPYELLLAALGSCMSMTMALYARRKQLALSGVTIRLRHSRNYAQDCADCAVKDVRLHQIETEVELTGTLTDEERARIMVIAPKCPMHRTLESAINIRIALVPTRNLQA